MQRAVVIRPWALGGVALAVALALTTSPSLPTPVAAPTLDVAATRAAFASPDPEQVHAALARLLAVEPPPTDWLLAQLRDPNRGIREWSAHALGDIAPQETRAVDALLVAFEDPDDYVRWKAARALGNIGAPAERALAVLEPVAESDQEVEVVGATARKAVRQIRVALATSSP